MRLKGVETFLGQELFPVMILEHHTVESEVDINGYIKECTGMDFNC
jgi:hypothetical protein